MSPLLPLVMGCLLAADSSPWPDTQVSLSLAIGPTGAGQITLTAIGSSVRADGIARSFRAATTAAATVHQADAMVICYAANMPMADFENGDGQLDLTPLFTELRAQSIGRVHVTVMMPGAEAVCEFAGRALSSRAQPGAAYQVFQADIPTDQVRAVLSFGFDASELPQLPGLGFDLFSSTPGDPAWLWLLVIAPLVTAGLAWRVRRLAARSDIDAVALGFRYWRFRCLLPVGVVTAWLALVAISGAAPHLDAWLPDPGTAGRAVRWALLYFLPPCAIMALGLAIAAPALRQLGEMDWPMVRIIRRSAIVPIIAYGALLTALLGVTAAATGSPRLGVALILAAIAAIVVASRRTRRALQLTPVPLTHGELCDRVAKLAAFFRVRVPQISVLPSDRSRMVNAFAVRGQGVWLSDRLVSGFGRREVDAIIAHELAHLRQFALRPRGKLGLGGGQSGPFSASS